MVRGTSDGSDLVAAAVEQLERRQALHQIEKVGAKVRESGVLGLHEDDNDGEADAEEYEKKW